MTQQLAIASLKAIKSSPVKVMKITKNVVGLNAAQALETLKFSNLKLASTVRALLYSAMSNAENNHSMNVDDLYVEEIDVGRAFALRRFAARGRGKSSRILKTFSNIRIILAEKQQKKQKGSN